MTARVPLPDGEIIDLYLTPNTLRNVADEFGVTCETIRRRLIKHGIALRPRGRMPYPSSAAPIDMNGSDFDSFKAEVRNFCVAFKMSRRRFGVLALKKANFVAEMDKGVESLPRTVKKVREFMANYEPERAR